MINLLPPQAKKRLNKEHRIRFGIIVLWSALLLEITGAVFFVPTYMTLKKSTEKLSTDLESKQAVSQLGSATSSKAVIAIKREIATLKVGATATDTPPSIVFSQVLEHKPRGIEINALAYQMSKDAITVQFAGVANTREDILAYKNALGKNPHFVLAKSSDGYILKKTNINFSVTLTYK